MIYPESSMPGTEIVSEVEKNLRVLFEPGQVVELRALGVSLPDYRQQHIESGYFDDLKRLAQDAASLNGSARGIYFSLQRIDPNLLSRAVNRMKPVGRGDPTTSDSNVTRLVRLLIDVDPVRPSGISSTDVEHERALAKALEIKTTLSAEGWPSPFVADSGNGAHLLYPIDLDPKDSQLCKSVLEALAFRFDEQEVTVDQGVFNPARICRAYGTTARKGDHTPQRPHRVSAILRSPKSQKAVQRSQLETLAAMVPDRPERDVRLSTTEGFDLDSWIADYGLEVSPSRPWKDGRLWKFNVCPWNDSHRDSSAYIVQFGSGGIAAGCHHNGCIGQDWRALRLLHEPDAYQQDAKSDANMRFGAVDQSTEAGRAWPEPIAEDAYYGIVGEVVRGIAPNTEADPNALLVMELMYAGNEIGRGPHSMAEADRHGTNINAILVGETVKGRKGTSEGHIRRLSHQADPTWAETRIWGGLSSGEGLIWAVRDPIKKTRPIMKSGRHTGDYETVIDDQGIDDKRLLVSESEFASVLKVMARSGNTLSNLIRQAWDRGDLYIMNKNSPAVATGAHISIFGHITRPELLRYISDTEMANGFANRFLWICTRRAQVLPEGGGSPSYGPLVQRLREALERARGVTELRRDREARAAWAAVYEDLSSGRPGLSGAVTARAEAQVLRLSVIYAALDAADAIRLPHLKAALAVWEYAERSAAYIFGDATGDPLADRISKALRPQGELTRTEISKLFTRNVSALRISQALDVLLGAGKVRFEKRDSEGRPIEVWIAA